MENADALREKLFDAQAQAGYLSRGLQSTLDRIRNADYTADDLSQNVEEFRRTLASISGLLNQLAPASQTAARRFADNKVPDWAPDYEDRDWQDIS